MFIYNLLNLNTKNNEPKFEFKVDDENNNKNNNNVIIVKVKKS